MLYPIQTQSQDCHQESPGLAAIMDEDIIQVLMLNESAIRIISKDGGLMEVRSALTDPETDKVPSTPLPSLRLYRLEIVVEQHELRCGEAILAGDGELVRPVSRLAVLDLLHECAVEEGTVLTGMPDS